MKEQESYIQRCLELAKGGAYTAAPNPMVGSLVVHKGEIIGEGYHSQPGEPHAEVNAICSVSNETLLSSSTLYVNLEPCSHHGKTPPCADLIIEKRIPKVVIGNLDVDPRVAGSGIAKLRQAGIEVVSGVLEQECRTLNRRFEIFHTQERPYIILKWAETLDGYIAREDGSSKWISSEASRRLVHKWRAEEASILVGTNTAQLDNPELTVRHIQGPNPIRIVFDRNLRLSENLNLFDGSAPTLVITEQDAESHGKTEYVQVSFDEQFPNVLCKELYAREIQSVLIEGGQQTLTTFLKANLWDEVRRFRAQKSFASGITAPDSRYFDKLTPAPKKEIDIDLLELFYRDPYWLIKQR